MQSGNNLYVRICTILSTGSANSQLGLKNITAMQEMNNKPFIIMENSIYPAPHLARGEVTELEATQAHQSTVLGLASARCPQGSPAGAQHCTDLPMQLPVCHGLTSHWLRAWRIGSVCRKLCGSTLRYSEQHKQALRHRSPS